MSDENKNMIRVTEKGMETTEPANVLIRLNQIEDITNDLCTKLNIGRITKNKPAWPLYILIDAIAIENRLTMVADQLNSILIKVVKTAL